MSAPPGEFHERRHACRWVHSSLVIAMLCSAALSRRFPVHDRRCRSSFDDHTGSAVPMIRAMVVLGAEPAHLGSVAEDLGRRTPQCISVVAIPTRSVIAMVTAEVVVEVSRVQRVDSQLVTKVSTDNPRNAERHAHTERTWPSRTGPDCPGRLVR